MKRCEFSAEISSLIDGELEPQKEEAILKHLDSCEECNAVFEEFLNLENLIETLPDKHEIIREHSKPEKPSVLIFRFILISGSIAAMLFLGFHFFTLPESATQEHANATVENVDSQAADAYTRGSRRAL